MRIAVAFDSPVPDLGPEEYRARMSVETASDFQGEPEPEFQVARGLEALGHTTVLVGAHESPDEVTEVLREFRPDVVFNLAEGFGGHAGNRDRFDFILPAAYEMEGHPYTGAGPQALMVTRNKAMSKKILAHHDLCVPQFQVFRLGETPAKAKSECIFPAIVKPLRLDASVGISQASVVYDAEQLEERVQFIHERVGDAAIVEQYIAGRELYATVLGNGRQAKVLPILELVFSDKLTRPEQRIATTRAKWDDDYCAERGIALQYARRMSKTALGNIQRTCTAAYRALWLRDYARFDLRLDDQDRVWVLEANANPYIGEGHESAESARKAGLDYPHFVERIAKLARRRHRRTRRRQARGVRS